MERKCHIVTDLGFGDAGKGSIVDALVRRYRANLVIRFNGGPQCAHNVVTPDGRHHTFAQWGSGTFVPGTRTYHDEHALIHPIALLSEGDTLIENGVSDAYERLLIHERCPVITPFQQAANHLRELTRGEHRHGSCGLGIGETMHDLEDCGVNIVRARDLKDTHKLRQKMHDIRNWKIAECRNIIVNLTNNRSARSPIDILFNEEKFEKYVEWYTLAGERVRIINDEETRTIIQTSNGIVCEGAQGILLDQDRGFFPYVTRSTTTSTWAYDLLRRVKWDDDVAEIGVMRAYHTRHGAGPFVTEDTRLTAHMPDTHNRDHQWAKAFRVGWTDLVALRYALEANSGVDAIAINHLDRPKSATIEWQCCNSYQFADETSPCTRLDIDPTDSKEKRTAFSQRMMTAQPRYTTYPVSTNHPTFSEHFSRYIEQALNTPVVVHGHGQSYEDKSWTLT